MLKSPTDAMPASFSVIFNFVRVQHKRRNMRTGLDDHQPCRPAMKEIESVVTKVQYPNERIVAESKQDCEDEVENCKSSTASSELRKCLGVWSIRDDGRVHDVTNDICNDDGDFWIGWDRLIVGGGFSASFAR